MSGYFEPRDYSFAIELGNGPFYSPAMGGKLSNGFAAVLFYDGPPLAQGTNLVTPTGGELVLTATESELPEDPNSFYGSIPSGTIDCTNPAYERPNWAGMTKHIKAVESVAVTGATHALVKILRT